MAKTKAKKLVDKRLDEFENRVLDKVEKYNKEAIEVAEQKLEITMDKIDHEAKQLGLEDFELLRREIDNLEETITNFNPTAEAEEAIKETIGRLRAKTEELERTINKTDEVIASVLQEKAEEGRERLDKLIREIEADYRKQWEEENPFNKRRWNLAFEKLHEVTRTETKHRIIWTSFQFIFTVVAVLVGIYSWVRWFQG